ncbi:MAG: hypothetical protein AAF206_23265 [Bacteroidota bacterium]
MIAKSFSLLGFFLFWAQSLSAQILWSWEDRQPIPEPVANNAVVAASVNGQNYVYSFSGIDSSRIFSGIHLKAWRYSVGDNVWDTLPPLPDTLGKIAAGASLVKGKIYIIGGYHVFANGNEASSDRVHVFDPQTNSYLADAAPIPVPIDDHIQAVWRDSLIFVITGWSNTTNVPDVQIFNPTLNQWTVGTAVPDQLDYKVFGGSGAIVGDTIVYAGGARFGQNFPLGNVFRIGIIDPNHPTQISWSNFSDPLALGYRMAAFTSGQNVIWAGGSQVSYNFDGIAYNGSGPVAPSGRMFNYSTFSQSLFSLPDSIPPLMDFRGVAELGNDQFMLVGGMEAGPQVTARVLLMRNLLSSSSNQLENSIPLTFSHQQQIVSLKVENQLPFSVSIIDIQGKERYKASGLHGRWQHSLQSFPDRHYFILFRQQDLQQTFRIWVR